jgi:hypothetical protein
MNLEGERGNNDYLVPEELSPVVEKSLALVEDFITDFYGSDIPQCVNENLKRLRRDKVIIVSDDLLEEMLLAEGKTQYQVRFNPGIHSPKDGIIVLRELASERIIVHELFHFISTNFEGNTRRAGSEKNRSRQSGLRPYKLLNEVITELLTYAARDTVSWKNDDSLFNMWRDIRNEEDFEHLVVGGIQPVGSYKTAVEKFFEFVLPDKGLDDILPVLADAYLTGEPVKLLKYLRVRGSEIGNIGLFSGLISKIRELPEGEVEEIISSVKYYGNEALRIRGINEKAMSFLKTFVRVVEKQDPIITTQFKYPEDMPKLVELTPGITVSEKKREIIKPVVDISLDIYRAFIGATMKFRSFGVKEIIIPFQAFMLWQGEKIEALKRGIELRDEDCFKSETMNKFMHRFSGTLFVGNIIRDLNAVLGLGLTKAEQDVLSYQYGDLLVDYSRSVKEEEEEKDKRIHEGFKKISEFGIKLTRRKN